MAEEMKQPLTLKQYGSVEEVLLDEDLAGLGDAYVNFVYSLAVSQRTRRPTGAKVNNRVLAEAVKRSGLRRLLPHRVDRHARGNAAESLIVFAWLSDLVSFEECVERLADADDATEAFAGLLRVILERLGEAV